MLRNPPIESARATYVPHRKDFPGMTITDNQAPIAWEDAYAQVRANVTIPACPEWCVKGDGHEYSPGSVFLGEVAGYAISRMHRSGPDEAVRVYGFEVATSTEIRPLSYGISLPDGVEDVSADEARTVASEVFAAVYLLDRITSGGQR
jgi:hypothetical protein